MIIDMELPSFPPTRPASPPIKGHLPPVMSAVDGSGSEQQENIAETPDASVGPPHQSTALGTLMKSAKKDVAVPEFDMSNFSF